MSKPILVIESIEPYLSKEPIYFQSIAASRVPQRAGFIETFPDPYFLPDYMSSLDNTRGGNITLRTLIPHVRNYMKVNIGKRWENKTRY